jgi:aldehyde dehydrogenase (NAD+)
MTSAPGGALLTAQKKLRARFESNQTRSAQYRRGQLQALKAMLQERQADICDALWTDLRKSGFEAYVSEERLVLGEINYAVRHLNRWLKPRRVHLPLHVLPAGGHWIREPWGVALIIGAWNYPIQLLLAPLVGAIAGGNACVLKPSELAPRCSSLMAELLPRYLDPDSVAVVEGGPDVCQALLEEPFDFIFFTGGAKIGRLVQEKAAHRLIPVVTELGGKCACIVDRSARLDVAARRIVWGKFLNAGQSCIAPDYVLADESIADGLVERMRDTIRSFYGDDPRQSADYGRIVNERHFARLRALLSDGVIVCGGAHDCAELYIAPTILRSVDVDAPSMAEEVFGPVLPLLTVRDLEAAINFIKGQEPALVTYLFAEDREAQKRISERVRSGAVCINDVALQMTAPELPFGGVGPSGFGRYHGRWGFEAFTWPKAILKRSARFDWAIRYPPYTARKLKWMRRFL